MGPRSAVYLGSKVYVFLRYLEAAMEINGAEAVVTGAAGGLGGAIARALKARGARLILTDRREEALKSLASQLIGAQASCAI